MHACMRPRSISLAIATACPPLPPPVLTPRRTVVAHVQANTLNRLVGACTGVVGTLRCDTVEQFGVTVLLEQGDCDVTAAGLAAVVTEVRGFAPGTDCSISGYIKDDAWCPQTTDALSLAMVRM